MGKLVFSDGGDYYRPDQPHLFSPGVRAAAHYLKAVERVDYSVRRKLADEVLGKHHFPRQFVNWQGLVLDERTIDVAPIPGQPEGPQRERFEEARPFLMAFQAWMNEHYMWSPFILELLYKVLELWDKIDREVGELQGTLRQVELYQERRSITREDERYVAAVKRRLEILGPERKGWGWWVDFLASDLTVAQLDAWLAAHGLCPPSTPGTRLLNMPSSPSSAALWIFDRLKLATSKTHGISTLSDDNRQLLERWDRLHIGITWGPASEASPFYVHFVLKGWQPEVETWATAKRRFQARFDHAVEEYRAAHEGRLKNSGFLNPRPKDSEHVKWGKPHPWEPVPSKKDNGHFEWLARRQIHGWTSERIAKHYRVQPVTVREGLRRTAELLHLELRPSRVGRPSVYDDL